MRILKDPLVYFLALGFGLFWLYGLLSPKPEALDDNVIVVDRANLMTYYQYRTRAFSPDAEGAGLEQLSATELDLLIADYVREEALHREAKALGVDKNDYIIKRRMIQSVEFITDGFLVAEAQIDQQDIKQYFAENQQDYALPPTVTFAHVFFNQDGRSPEQVQALAESALAMLNQQQIPFDQATAHGERFPFFVNYVERDPQYVTSHFGRAMSDVLFTLDPDPSRWQGPLQSSFGSHLVLLTERTPARMPELDEVYAAVQRDTERAMLDERRDAAVQAIIDTYDVRYEYPPANRPSEAAE